MANVFISHAGEDSAVAADLRRWLVDEGHTVFLDRDLRDGIVVGEEWEQRLYDQLRRADATVCVVTNAYLNSVWCVAEVAIARSRGVVLLPVCAEKGVTHPLLAQLHYADVEAAREPVLEALRRIDHAGGVGWSGERSPFPGLRAFDAGLHRAFFGRNEDIDKLTGLLRSPAERSDNAVLLVFGPSGCGKSSLVRAGLVPRMADEPDWWTLPVFTPGVDPHQALVRELAGAFRDLGPGRPIGDVQAALERGEVFDELLLAVPGKRRRRLLIVIDQAEELLTQAEDRAKFAADLRLALKGPVDVVATIRPEFLADWTVDPDLAAVRSRTYMVRPLRRETLRTVIEGPARLAGIKVGEDLVARLVEDTESGDALPLLAFTLEQLAKGVPRGGELSAAQYDALGGVRGALTRQAEVALAETGRSREDVLKALLRLVTVDEQGNPTRWHGVPVPELDAFVEHRLLTVDSAENGEARVSASHEKFFTAWPPLEQAIGKAAETLRARRSIEQAAAAWHTAKRRDDDLWERRQLTSARAVDETELSQSGREFLTASRRSSNSRRRVIVSASAALIVVALVAGVIAFVQQRSAAQRQQEAREQALVATVRQLGAKASAVSESDPRTALMLGLAAHKIHPDAETYAALQRTLTTTPYAGQLVGVSEQVSSIAYSSTGRYLAAGFDSGAIMLWDLRDPLRPRRLGDPFIGFKSRLNLAFAAGDRRLVATGTNGAVTMWDVADPEHPRQTGTPVQGQKDKNVGGWLSADGTLSATSGEDSPAVQLWDLSDPANVHPAGAPVTAYAGKVEALAFSPDGALMATSGGGTEDPVVLWDIHDRAAPRSLARITLTPKDLVGTISFSADGKKLALGGQLRGTSLWTISDPANPKPARDLVRVSIGSRVTFSTHGDALATTAGRDTGLVLWDTESIDFPSRTERLQAGEEDRITTFSPDGQMVASGSTSGRITLWNLARAGRPRAFGPPIAVHRAGRYKEIYGMALSPDATVLATAGRDNTVELWDITDRARPRKIDTLTARSDHEGVDAVAFAPGGRLLAFTEGNDKVVLVDLADRDHPRRLDPALTGSTNIIRRLVFSPDGTRLTAGGDSGTTVWDVADPARTSKSAQLLDKEGVLAVDQVRDGRVLAVVRGSGAAPMTTTAVAAPTIPTTTNSNGSAAVGSSDSSGRWQGGPGDPNGARLWDITDPAHPRQLGAGLLGHSDRVASAAVSPAGDLLMTGDAKGAAILWDIKDPEHPRRLGDPLVPHGTQSVLTATFAPSADIMVTGGITNGVFLWDLGNRILPEQLGTSLADNGDAVYHLEFSPASDLLATGGSNGTVVLWDLKPTHELRGKLDETACAVTGGGLDRDLWARYVSDLDFRESC
ncbi:TIR domain-containing protein [Lentzea sp. NPDC005914]|uniref:nSTAND1 domain-containing NTPase n=1 Tax=Lentzea sp. NPDC005914 TaxID=3154572 RepID=UPI0033C978C6